MWRGAEVIRLGIRSCIFQNKYVFLYLSNITTMQTANYSDLRSHLKTYLDKVIQDSEPLLVHRSGNESVVVISLEEYNAIKETEYIMKSPAMMEIIRKGDEEIARGGGEPVKVEDLWK